MHAIWAGLNWIGLISLITIAYGVVQPLSWARWIRHGLLGVVFGIGAWACMMNPIEVGPGVIADSRNLFIGFAGAFLGPMAAGIAFAIAGAVRISIGGNGALIGLSSMFVALVIGVLWGVLREKEKALGYKYLMIMGLTFSIPLLVGVTFLPEDARTNFLEIIPIFVTINLFGTIIFGTLLERERAKSRHIRKLLNQTFKDPLTDALNRRGLEEIYNDIMISHTYKGRGAILLDLDHFKKVNDTYGHAAGDRTIKITTQAIKDVIRSGDILARVGGEEFMVLFPNISEYDFISVSERIRMSIKLARNDDCSSVTASIGGTYWNAGGRRLDDVMQAADKMMYEAKNLGRDRLVSDLTLRIAAE